MILDASKFAEGSYYNSGSKLPPTSKTTLVALSVGDGNIWQYRRRESSKNLFSGSARGHSRPNSCPKNRHRRHPRNRESTSRGIADARLSILRLQRLLGVVSSVRQPSAPLGPFGLFHQKRRNLPEYLSDHRLALNFRNCGFSRVWVSL